ncbi:hypothetical protein HO173_000388 [Letharia columbiana]|uniref:Subtelomeric hrmA-associated cluster protein AFUB-079030/YDR124W-like helical bundle domain-containing protein n=1 Tax=Letharia columbiana TaxID=112416 RepID=A0A8H6LAL4_9LECA|nr:uncharacterized protein HO173_000388 [Letharia columbiana]KAF6241677.1 hypothetical protein HO173_000388 [Letharia columbiana]
MVQRVLGDRGPCRPVVALSKTTIDSFNDDANRTSRLPVTEGSSNALSTLPLQALIDHCNIHACEITFRLDSGKVFQATTTRPEPQEVHDEELLTRQVSRSSVYTVEDFDQEETASGSGKARSLPIADRRSQTTKRKRKGSSSHTPASRIKRRPAENRRAAIKSGCNSESVDENENDDEDADEDADNAEDDSDSDSDFEDEIDELEGAETEMEQFRIDEVFLRYYEPAFRSINQLVCKDISKLWIRFCHPGKQTTHPYNGGKSTSEKSTSKKSQAEHGYLGHFTKPDYWPSDAGWKAFTASPRRQTEPACRHIEPDHEKKPERLLLLVHLLRSQNRGFKDGVFTLDKMAKSTKGIHLEYPGRWTTQCVERLKEIYRVRAMEMKYEAGEIDGSTLVSVRMLRTRRKIRKVPKSAVKASGLPREQIKKEPQPEVMSSTACHAPVAKMGINVQIGDEDLASSSSERVAPQASSPKPRLCKARTIQHGLPFYDSPSPKQKRHNSAQENWSTQPADLTQDPTVFTHPNFFGSWMQSFPSQEFVRRQYDHESTASQVVANPMRPNGAFTRSPPAGPVATRVEHARPPTFVASSSGLVGAFSTGTEYSSWQTDDPWNPQAEPSMYSAVPGPSTSLLPCTNGSFSNGYSGANFSSGLPLDIWNDGNQTGMPPYHQGVDEDVQHCLNLQAVGMPWYEPLSLNTPSSGNPALANQVLPTGFRPHTSLDAEHKFEPVFQDQQQL